MIDVHAHILPELDDGSFDTVCSIEMAEIAVSSGVTAMVATPHCNQRRYFENYASDKLYDNFAALKEELRRSDIPLELYLGMEVFGTEDAARLFRAGRLLTVNGGRYMLVEFDFGADVEYMDAVLESLRAAGCVPIIAHPERYEMLRCSGETVEKWLDGGMGVQINKGSLSGKFGRGARAFACELLDNGLVSCIASDAHGPQMRTPDMSEARSFVAIEYSEELAELLFEENPRRIVMNEPLLRANGINYDKTR